MIRRPHYKLEELDDLSRPVDDQRSGRGSGARRYRRSLLRLLPHAWSSSVDTRLEVAMLYRHGPNGKGSGEGLGRKGIRHSSSGRGKPSPPNEDDRGRAETRGTGGGAVQAVVARTREGLEAVELSTGRPLGSVALPAASSGGGGVYADLNGDGVVDHVQVERRKTKLACSSAWGEGGVGSGPRRRDLERGRKAYLSVFIPHLFRMMIMF